MPPTSSTRHKRARRYRHTDDQISSQLPVDLPFPYLKPFDLFSPKLQKLKDSLRTARKNMHDLEIQDADTRHQLAEDLDSLFPGSEPSLHQHNELAMSHHQWYRDLRNIYRQRIRKLEIDIAKESNYANWRKWSSAEFLLRWQSGNMNYSIFKNPEATSLVRTAFELEVGLELPEEKVIALVSAQVAAGWYSTPLESVDWLPRKTTRDYVDRDWPGDDESTRSVYVSGHSLRNTFIPENKQIQCVDKATTLREKSPSAWKRRLTQAARDEQAVRTVYKTEHPGWQRFDPTPSYDQIPRSNRPWAEKYPLKEYSDGEIEDIIQKANSPEKPMKWVNMIAGRTSTRMVIADEYVE
ncbi:uncharacterized protein RSE6_12039 [Rhynchosporium secalis]|uniref:Uncharacterized protein n=1 Tax=Rhynchosporium secalis TaxID=38038 RepID=A0A1E1MPF3_RHYSE|nr:uncharacterized protein RSE6_12039 [Rhynchosporium secalis]